MGQWLIADFSVLDVHVQLWNGGCDSGDPALALLRLGKPEALILDLNRSGLSKLERPNHFRRAP
jgi:hypothetical protein